MSAPAMLARLSGMKSNSGGAPMMYAVLCYNAEDMVCGWTKEEDESYP